MATRKIERLKLGKMVIERLQAFGVETCRVNKIQLCV